MAMRGIDDRCPECPCDEWTGYCGHFDCNACSQLRAFKQGVRESYARKRGELPPLDHCENTTHSDSCRGGCLPEKDKTND